MRRALARVALGGIVLGTMVAALGSSGTLPRPGSAAGQGAGPPPPALPSSGSTSLQIITPSVLELSWITADVPVLTGVAPAGFTVLANGNRIGVRRVGLKRRVRWADLQTSARQIATSVFLELDSPVRPADRVVVTHVGADFPGGASWTALVDEQRTSPALHVNLAGYLPRFAKHAAVGLYLGTLGELPLDGVDTFVVEALDGREQVRGRLLSRPDRGMPGSPPAYQQVGLADFTALERPGVYRLRVPGLGVSAPFRIDEGAAAALARAYALGLYHQRCGDANRLPFTRFTHDACHMAPAEIPQPGAAASVEARLEASTAPAAGNPRHTARRLRSLADALYPAARRGTIDVHGGHHDAGDYGKYAINSAQFIHHLLLAADLFPGVRALDNLGLPESGDGAGDLVQLVRWEADFLARLQDDDGGFFFLVQPRDRSYEGDVLPDEGDPQVVFPKNTSATAAAVAALAQAASSPAFRAAFPADAARHLASAQRGWRFLQRAWAAHGREGAYQRVTHYGDVFEDRDEIAWAATELFLATGDPSAHAMVLQEFDPLSTDARRWGWWALFEGYGAAARSYAFANETGRATGWPLDAVHLIRCRQAVRSWGADVATASHDSAYGTSYPDASKRGLLAGWYFSENNVFDLLVARRLDGGTELDEAIADNLGFLAGANPANVSYVTGVGTRFPRELVSQFAQNDRRALPPSGVPLGNLQQGLPVLGPHGPLLRAVSLPPDEDVPAPYPIYDRWSDVFNTMGEATIVDQARALASTAALMAETPLARQVYGSVAARIEGLPPLVDAGQGLRVRLEADGLDADQADVVWEWGAEPAAGREVDVSFTKPGPAWLEVEAVWPDGRRAFAAEAVTVR